MSESSGTGRPYEGKPQPGIYYRLIPGYTCNGLAQIHSQLEVTDEQVVLRSHTPDCREKLEDVTNQELSFGPNSPQLIGYGDGIFEVNETKPDANAAAHTFIATWCQGTDRSNQPFDVVLTEKISTAEIRAHVRSVAGTQQRESASSRELASGRIVYTAPQFKLTVDTATGNLPTQKPVHTAQLLAVDGSTTPLTCRLGSILDPQIPAKPAYAYDFSVAMLPESLEFRRAGRASFVSSSGMLEWALADQPRFEFSGADSSALGLLIEGGATNLLTHSEGFDQASWVKEHVAVTANSGSAQAPDGATTAELLQDAATSGEHVVHHAFDHVPGQLVTFSLYAKPAGASSTLSLRLIDSDSYADAAWMRFDLGSGQATLISVTGTAQNVAGDVQRFANGWFRLSLTASPSTRYSRMRADVWPNPGGILTGNPSAGFYVWGAQVESGPQMTSYIATSTATADRAGDFVHVRDLSPVPPQEGTVMIKALRNSSIGAGQPSLFSLEGTAGEIMTSYLDSNASPLPGFQALVGNVNWATTAEIPKPGVLQSVALGYKSTDSVLFVNGVQSQAPANVNPLTSASSLVIGGRSGGSQWNGTIRSFRYWPQRLDDATLLELNR